MKAFLDERQRHHNPKTFLVRGKLLESPEQVARIDALKTAATQFGCSMHQPNDFGMAPLAKIHSAEYLTFLQTIHTRWSALPNAGDEVIPNIHPDRRSASYPQSAVGQAGYHQADTACPISSGTYEASYWSAQTALSAAGAILEGDKLAYALCRPPGHHAFTDMAGGFCFLNNSAIAAQRLLDAGLRPAILDIDVHHGNGTQGIFYQRADMLTVSIHADVDSFYPFFWGFAHERGAGAGLGYNLNLPLAPGSSDDKYLVTLAKAMDQISIFGANVIVVALGLDAYENDPLKGLSITTAGFAKIATTIAQCGMPLLMVQEGGYLSPELGENLQSFFSGLR